MGGWQFDLDNLNFYKTEVEEIYTVDQLGITHRAEVTLRDGQAGLGAS